MRARNRIRRTGRFAITAVLFLVMAAAVALADGTATRDTEGGRRLRVKGRTTYLMPSVSLKEYVRQGSDSVRIWAAAVRPADTDRSRLYQGIAAALSQHTRFAERVSGTYPRNQPEWLLITDAVSDTLTDAVTPLVEAYEKAHPEEILTDGRQQLELALMRIAGPPPRMLGFHVVMLSNFIYSKADSLLSAGKTTDVAGVEDGVLRSIGDWCELYQQVHADPISVFESRTNQEDWIIARMEDNCGNKGGGTWQLVQQWMAVVDRDSSVTPPVDLYAHEIHLKPVKCPGDTVVFFVDLPNYHQVQLEVSKKQAEGKLGRAKDGGN
jgi:hypothetical protein